MHAISSFYLITSLMMHTFSAEYPSNQMNINHSDTISESMALSYGIMISSVFCNHAIKEDCKSSIKWYIWVSALQIWQGICQNG